MAVLAGINCSGARVSADETGISGIFVHLSDSSSQPPCCHIKELHVEGDVNLTLTCALNFTSLSACNKILYSQRYYTKASSLPASLTVLRTTAQFQIAFSDPALSQNSGYQSEPCSVRAIPRGRLVLG